MPPHVCEIGRRTAQRMLRNELFCTEVLEMRRAASGFQKQLLVCRMLLVASSALNTKVRIVREPVGRLRCDSVGSRATMSATCVPSLAENGSADEEQWAVKFSDYSGAGMLFVPKAVVCNRLATSRDPNRV